MPSPTRRWWRPGARTLIDPKALPNPCSGALLHAAFWPHTFIDHTPRDRPLLALARLSTECGGTSAGGLWRSSWLGSLCWMPGFALAKAASRGLMKRPRPGGAEIEACVAVQHGLFFRLAPPREAELRPMIRLVQAAEELLRQAETAHPAAAVAPSRPTAASALLSGVAWLLPARGPPGPRPATPALAADCRSSALAWSWSTDQRPQPLGRSCGVVATPDHVDPHQGGPLVLPAAPACPKPSRQLSIGDAQIRFRFSKPGRPGAGVAAERRWKVYIQAYRRLLRAGKDQRLGGGAPGWITFPG